MTIEPSVRLAVRGDPVRLRQILTNLVSNAIKFTPRGSVMIHVSKRGETRTHYETLFAVKDTGVGIAPDAAAKLFQPFSQADASTTRIHGGTGLGLVICKRIVELMNGKIGVRSEPGKGSLFWFSVPLLKAFGDLPNGRRDVHGSRALVLSSDTACLRRLGGYFTSWGVTFLQTAAAADALAKLRAAASMGDSWTYDLLILDLGALPASAALGLLKNVSRDPALNTIRFVVMLGEEAAPAELAAETRVVCLSRQYSEGELRGALLKLLGASDHPATGVGIFAPSPIEPVAQAHGSEPAAATAPLGGHVLLVEDNAVNRQVAQRLLGLIGVSMVLAENGKEALDALDQQPFDAVLMDCQMPVMDGYTATRIRRQNEAGQNEPNKNEPGKSSKHIPIIAMTANAMAGDREKCLNAGMDDYMSKPLNRALLEQTLRRWLPAGAKSRTVAALSSFEKPTTISAVKASAVTALAPPTATREGVLDTDVVRDLLDVMGDEFTDLVRVYLEDTPKAIAALEQAAARADTEGLIAPAHSLKSTSANLGALGLSELAKRLEHDARTGNLGNAAPLLVAEIQRSFQQVTVELNSLLAKSAV